MSQFLPLLSSLFLTSSSSQEASLALKLMLTAVKETPAASSAMLTLLLHKLAGSSSEKNAADPALKLLLLQVGECKERSYRIFGNQLILTIWRIRYTPSDVNCLSNGLLFILMNRILTIDFKKYGDNW